MTILLKQLVYMICIFSLLKKINEKYDGDLTSKYIMYTSHAVNLSIFGSTGKNIAPTFKEGGANLTTPFSKGLK